jgi:hypothetical protein
MSSRLHRLTSWSEIDCARLRKSIWRGFAVVALVIWLGKIVFLPGASFDAARWSDPKSHWDNGRIEMARRLVARRALAGKTRSELVPLLGNPDQSSPQEDWNNELYFLGQRRGLMNLLSPPFGFAWMQVWFDEGGHVSATNLFECSSGPI